MMSMVRESTRMFIDTWVIAYRQAAKAAGMPSSRIDSEIRIIQQAVEDRLAALQAALDDLDASASVQEDQS